MNKMKKRNYNHIFQDKIMYAFITIIELNKYLLHLYLLHLSKL